MVLKSSALIFFVLTLSSARAKVFPELMAKQSNENIRLISADGKFTYYQKRSGSLHFSSNYKIQDVLKGPLGTQYTIFSTPARKKIVILKNESFHTFYSLRLKEKIYISNFGEANTREIGEGISPALHLNDNWISFYDPFQHIINFENTINGALKFSIRLNNRINPYFIPQVIMTDENTVYYTDLGETGTPGLIEFKRNTNKSEIILKNNSVTTRTELILCHNKMIYAEFGIAKSPVGSQVFSSELPLKDSNSFKSKLQLYSSDLNDLGHLTCDFKDSLVYFIKNVGSRENPAFDIYQLNIEDKKLIQISDMKYVTSIINMDGTLLTLDKGHYLVINSETDFKTIDVLKKAVINKEQEKEFSEEEKIIVPSVKPAIAITPTPSPSPSTTPQKPAKKGKK